MSAAAPLGVLLSLVFPGLGQGLAGKRRRMLAWAVGSTVPALAIAISVWFVPVMLLARLASAIDAYLCLQRSTDRRYVDAAAAFLLDVVLLVCVRLFAVEGFNIPSSSMYPTLFIGDHIFVDKVSLAWHAPERGEVVVFTQPCLQRTFVKRVIARGGDTVEVRCSQVYVNGTPATSTLVSPKATFQDRDEASGRWYPRETSRYREHLGGRTYDTFHDVGRPEGDAAAARGDFPSRERMFAPSCAKGGAFFDSKDTPPAQPVGRIVETKPEAAAPCEPQAHFEVPPGTLFMMGDNRNNANDSRYWGVVREDAVIGRVTGIWMSDGLEGDWSRFGAIE